jgi:hypothetical protein
MFGTRCVYVTCRHRLFMGLPRELLAGARDLMCGNAPQWLLLANCFQLNPKTRCGALSHADIKPNSDIIALGDRLREHAPTANSNRKEQLLLQLYYKRISNLFTTFIFADRAFEAARPYQTRNLPYDHSLSYSSQVSISWTFRMQCETPKGSSRKMENLQYSWHTC